MGSQMSRANSSNRRDTSSSPPAASADLSSYEAACQADPTLRSFDSSVQLRTTQAINSIAVGLEVRTLSLESLSQVTESLFEMNQEVVKIILQNKRDVWNNPELSDLVDDYFQNSLLTLDFCTSLDSCLKRAGHIESLINVVVKKFEEEHVVNSNQSAGSNSSSSGSDEILSKYSKTLEELRGLSLVSDPFGDDFLKAFNSVYNHQLKMLERLHAKKRKLDAKLGKMKSWRRVSNVIFVVAFATVLICSVVAAAISAPPVVAALAAAAAVPLGSMGRWLNSIWKKFERDLKGQKELVGALQMGTYIVVKDLDGIRVLVERLKIDIESLVTNAEFGISGGNNDESMLVVAVEEIKKKIEQFVKKVSDLNEHANKCTQETRMARTLILRKIINHPSGSNQEIGGMFS